MKYLLFSWIFILSAFDLSAQTNDISTSAIVDLGLSVKWAGYNMGATSPEKYGKFYGWADPTGLKTSSDLDDYPSANPPKAISGTKYDIARAKWGGYWRLPTKAEMKELISKCKWTRFTFKKVSGYKVTGPNGNSIFMPCNGSDPKSGSPGGFGITGNYWTGDLNERDDKSAYGLFFDKDHIPTTVNESKRYFGKAIRPVVDQEEKILADLLDAYAITGIGATLATETLRSDIRKELDRMQRSTAGTSLQQKNPDVVPQQPNKQTLQLTHPRQTIEVASSYKYNDELITVDFPFTNKGEAVTVKKVLLTRNKMKVEYPPSIGKNMNGNFRVLIEPKVVEVPSFLTITVLLSDNTIIRLRMDFVKK